MNKREALKRRKKRVAAAIGKGTDKKPRLSVFRSNTGVLAQIIDDGKGVTLVSASSFKEKKGANIVAAKKVGEELAKKAQDKKIKTVIFDRNGYGFHGRVKAVADGAREAGLQF